MKKFYFVIAILLMALLSSKAQEVTRSGPDTCLKVTLNIKKGMPVYSVTYQEKVILEDSPLGLLTNAGDFSKGMTYVKHTENVIDEVYVQDRIKKSRVRYHANELVYTLKNSSNDLINLVFRVSNNDIAFRYIIPEIKGSACIVIESEKTGFDFPQQTTTFLCPMATPMSGWERTKPSYEEEYTPDEPIGTPSKFGYGHTFPCLFHIDRNHWALVSETGVGSTYCASHLSEGTKDGLYRIAFPDEKEMNGLGSSKVGLALPGETPWRTITVGNSLRPIVETTIPFDVVKPMYEASQQYKFGRSTWSWIMWQDAATCYDDQVTYIDLAAEMGYEYVLVDALWDTQIGRERMEELIKYAQSKNVGVFLWYNSNGYWNDAPQGPKHCLWNSIVRTKEMKWLKANGVKGLKIDFFGGDKQEMTKLYEDILSDANEYGLMIIYHGCTLPRGWERMYPNYVGSEAVLASENLVFSQYANDREAYNACLHPFIRNAVGSMEFGGTLLNKRHNRTNDGGNTRRTTDAFQLATAILYQNPVQNFAITPNNLVDVPAFEIDFMKSVPTTWDETRFLDGYPGKYCVIARRHAGTWYIVGVNAEKEIKKLSLDLSELNISKAGYLITDNANGKTIYTNSEVPRKGIFKIEIQREGGFIAVY